MEALFGKYSNDKCKYLHNQLYLSPFSKFCFLLNYLLKFVGIVLARTRSTLRMNVKTICQPKSMILKKGMMVYIKIHIPLQSTHKRAKVFFSSQGGTEYSGLFSNNSIICPHVAGR